MHSPAWSYAVGNLWGKAKFHLNSLFHHSRLWYTKVSSLEIQAHSYKWIYIALCLSCFVKQRYHNWQPDQVYILCLRLKRLRINDSWQGHLKLLFQLWQVNRGSRNSKATKFYFCLASDTFWIDGVQYHKFLSHSYIHELYIAWIPSHLIHPY